MPAIEQERRRQRLFVFIDLNHVNICVLFSRQKEQHVPPVSYSNRPTEVQTKKKQKTFWSKLVYIIPFDKRD